MRFKVPQFIEIEDKIIGPLTLKQFLYIGGGAVVLIVFWFFLEIWAFILAAIPVVIISALFAFYKYNGKPLINLVLNFTKYLSQPRLYLWKKENKKHYDSNN